MFGSSHRCKSQRDKQVAARLEAVEGTFNAQLENSGGSRRG